MQRRAAPTLATLVALGTLLGPAPGARAADADVRVLQVQLEIERRLLDAASRRWLDQLEGERRAAQAVDAASAQAAASLRRAALPASAIPADAPPVATVAEARATLTDAERAMSAALASSRAISSGLESQSLRVGALEAALAAMQDRVVATPLDGTWDLIVEPGRRGTLHLTQVGTLVTGDYAMLDGASGSVTGTFAAGRLRLDRIDGAAGKDAILDGTLAAGRLEGTWLSTIFGRGVAESGRWSAVRRSEIVAPPPEPQ